MSEIDVLRQRLESELAVIRQRIERTEERLDHQEDRWSETWPSLTARIEHLERVIETVATRTERIEARLITQAAVSAGGAAGVVEIVARLLG